jgi:hypothetical protein
MSKPCVIVLLVKREDDDCFLLWHSGRASTNKPALLFLVRAKDGAEKSVVRARCAKSSEGM